MSELHVTFLGTSSGKPTLARNVSAVAVVLDGQMVMFDCGEGTQIQVMRAGLKPSRLALACISHLHGDHINGLPGFLSTMGLNQHERTLQLRGARGLLEYLRALRRLGIFVPRFDLDTREITSQGEVFRNERFRVLAAPLRHRIPTWGFRLEEHDRPGQFDLETAQALGIPRGPLYGKLQRRQTVTLDDGRVIHPDQVVGRPRPGRVIAYVPDTRPCEGSLWLARRADLLIHEGTYSHELRADAVERSHCTVVEAAETARDAGAKRLAITHISPKHDDPRPLRAQARAVFERTVIAKDLLTLDVRVHDRPAFMNNGAGGG